MQVYKEQLAQLPWRSGHRNRLSNRRPGFESRQGVRFFWEYLAMLWCGLT
jgi:hypothetical protein